MIDIKFLVKNPDIVRENIKKKFQDSKLPLVDKAIDLYQQYCDCQQRADDLRSQRNSISKEIGILFKNKEVEKANELKKVVEANAQELESLAKQQTALMDELTKVMYAIPNIVAPSVPVGPDDTHNVEVEKFGEPVVPDFEVPYHADIMAKFNGLDLDAAHRVAGNGFYYLMGDIARLHSAVITYARDFMIERGFTYCIPPFMVRSEIVSGVMSFAEMDAMMYKIEGEDLYLIGTSEHSMIGKFIDQMIP